MIASTHSQRLLALLFPALAVLAGCSASVDPGTEVTDPLAITVLPASSVANPVIMYSGLPTTLVISGGNGQYLAASNNQAVLPIAGGTGGKHFMVVPNPVLADTTVTLTIRDTTTTPVATVVALVRPGTVNNNITITPNPLQSASCLPGVCTGGDAQVSVTISQGGNPLAFRAVDFSVVSGDFRFITTPPGTAPEQLALVARVVTDQAGLATLRIRATALAPNQTALLQVTDVSTGAFQRAAFVIAQFTGNTPAFFTVPSAITFTGPFIGQCPQSGAANVTIHGGSPPYTVQNSSNAFFLQAPNSSPSTSGAITVFQSGGYFTVQMAGQICVTNMPVSITDSTGRTITMLLTSQEGTTAAPPPAFQVVPTSINIGTCNTAATVVAVGGSGTYFAASADSRLEVTVAGGTVTVKRTNTGGLAPPLLTLFTVPVTDGATTVSVGVTAPTQCP